MKRIRNLLFLSLLLCLTLPPPTTQAQGGDNPLGYDEIRFEHPNDNFILDIYQDPRGFLWFATQGGGSSAMMATSLRSISMTKRTPIV